MKYLLLGLSVAIGLSTATSATAGMSMAETPLMVPIHHFIDNFDKGDVKTAAKAFASGSVAIIDEFPPHIWVGAHALQQWSKTLEAVSKQEGDTDDAVTLGEATRADVNGDRGYVVVPAVFTYKEHGTAMRETAQMVYTLKQTGGLWLITGWTWVGTKPVPDAASAK
jgi:hypothetical protein